MQNQQDGRIETEYSCLWKDGMAFYFPEKL